jgi:predicted nucleic acid-binding protein
LILDTNALSAFADAEPDIATHIGKAQRIAIPVIVVGEYLFGIAQSSRRNEYQRWLNSTLRSCQVLGIDEETSANYSEVRLGLKRAGTPIPANDAWIAALCRQHSLPLLSRDRHFDLVSGIRRLGW